MTFTYSSHHTTIVQWKYNITILAYGYVNCIFWAADVLIHVSVYVKTLRTHSSRVDEDEQRRWSVPETCSTSPGRWACCTQSFEWRPHPLPIHYGAARRPWWRDVKLLRNVALDLRPWSSLFVYISLSNNCVGEKRCESLFRLNYFLIGTSQRSQIECTFLRKWKSRSFPRFYPPQISWN